MALIRPLVLLLLASVNIIYGKPILNLYYNKSTAWEYTFCETYS